MEWKDWSSIAFTERYCLPSSSGIYVVVDASDCVWYVGQAANIKARWAGKTHHRYPQLIRSNKKRSYRIHWQELSVDLLTEKEKYYIELLKPALNGCKVKKYLPKQPQVEQEIKRLLKVLNNPTFLFTVIRSVVAGEYEDNGGIRCIVILINANDTSLLFKSMPKKHSPQVKNAWGLYKSYCGKNEQLYQSSSIIVYSFFKYRFEFIEVPNIIFYLEEHLSIHERYVGVTELLGVQVKAFKYLDIFHELPTIAIQQELKGISDRLRKIFPSTHPQFDSVFEDLGAAGYYLREAGYRLESVLKTVQGDGENEVSLM